MPKGMWLTVISYEYQNANFNLHLADANQKLSSIPTYHKFDLHVLELIDKTGTKDKVLCRIKCIADELEGGDFFVFYYLGHGDRQPDSASSILKGDEAEDTILVLPGGDIIDDEIALELKSFKEDVRILIIFDCCYAGEGVIPIFIPMMNPFNYLTKLKTDNNININLPKASVLSFGASANGLSYTGRFTETLVEVWNEGSYAGNYNQFVHDIDYRLSSLLNYNPQSKLGKWGKFNNVFENQTPFVI